MLPQNSINLSFWIINVAIPDLPKLPPENICLVYKHEWACLTTPNQQQSQDFNFWKKPMNRFPENLVTKAHTYVRTHRLLDLPCRGSEKIYFRFSMTLHYILGMHFTIYSYIIFNVNCKETEYPSQNITSLTETYCAKCRTI